MSEYTLFAHDIGYNPIVHHFLAKDNDTAHQVGSIVYKHLNIHESIFIEGWHVPLQVSNVLIRYQPDFVELIKVLIPKIVEVRDSKPVNRMTVFHDLELARLRAYLQWCNDAPEEPQKAV